MQPAKAERAGPSGRVRKPGYAALVSAIVPGLGQVYNGEAIKGFVLLALFMVCFALTGVSLRGQIAVSPMSPRGSLYGQQVDVGAILSALFSGIGGVWTVLLLAVYILSIADAAIRAGRRASSDDSGLV
jgi:TM2 domain-containing membrane protein YozV